MSRPYCLLAVFIVASVFTGCAASVSTQSKEIKTVKNSVQDEQLEGSIFPPAECPVTLPQDPTFIPPAPYPDLGFDGEFWYGFDHLWTALPVNGVWKGLPNTREGYTQKVFWWSSLFSWKDEPEPELVVFGERLDASAPPLKVSRATNASAGDIGTAMLVGVDFPTPGCWKMTGQYKKSGLSFVVWVTP